MVVSVQTSWIPFCQGYDLWVLVIHLNMTWVRVVIPWIVLGPRGNVLGTSGRHHSYKVDTTCKGQLYPCDGIFVQLKWGVFWIVPHLS